jgi:hypothetical protein
MRFSWLLVICSVISFLSVPLAAEAFDARVCTREPGSRVVLREGPGIDYQRGLVAVGSGGTMVLNSFQEQGFAVRDGEEISIFSYTHGTDGRIWYQVGNNQWVAWVRSDFVCRLPNNSRSEDMPI